MQIQKEILDNKKKELQKNGINPDTISEIIEKEKSIQKQTEIIKHSEIQYNEGISKYEKGLKEYKIGMGKIKEYENSVNKLNQKRKEYKNGLKQYQNGIEKLNKSKVQYQNGLSQIQSAKSKISSGFAKLNTSQKELDLKKEEFKNKNKKAQSDIDNAKSKIHDAQLELDGLSVPVYSTYTRRTMSGGDGIKMVEITSSGISKVSNLFPVVLYLVAALVTVTTMTRFVNEERNNAGILKALGYNNIDVIKKIVIYGLFSGMIGTVLGAVLGSYVLPYILCSSLLANMTLPTVKLNFYFNKLFIAIICSIICSVLPAVYISIKELKETSAQLLLPKPPTKGSKIFLERIKPLWRKMSFTQKVTARNIFRYKQRMLMTIFGVAGSVALLLAGLGIASSINGIQTKQFGDIIQYDAVVAKKDSVTEKEQQKINKLLKSDKISAYIPIYSDIITKNIKGLEDNQTITIMVSNKDTFSLFINLEDKNDSTKIKIKDEGVIITQKLAYLMKKM